jgi:hypothetical protein
MKSKLFLAVALIATVGFAARYEQPSVGELTTDDIIFGGTKITATAAELNALADAPAPGIQSEALGTNESATVAVESSQVNITGPTNAETAVVTLTAPSSAQLGQSVVIYNAGTNSLSIVYTAGSTNDVAAAGLMLIHAASTNGWSYLEIPALDSELTKLALKDGSGLTNMAPATAFPGYAVCVVTNLDLDGTTNILTYIGTVAREQ